MRIGGVFFMRDLKRILELRFENHSQREIARMLKVSRNTVRDVFDAADAAGVYWNIAYNLSESQINELLFPSNGIDVSYEQPDYAYVHKELLKVGVSLKMLWKEYVDQCKSTHKVYLKYSAFCNNYSSYVKKNKLMMHITHKPGDRIMVDWDGKTMKVHDRSLNQDVTAYMFVAVLPFSMYCYLEACPHMDSKNWINCHIHAFEYFGGVSRILVPDNLKTGVIEHKKYEDPVLNKSYQEMADYYGMAIIPTRVKKPRDKSAAEGSVFSVATTIIGKLRNRTFFTFESLNKAIYIELNKLNNEEFQKREGSRKSVYMDEEKDFMNPLPEHPFELSEWKMATVQMNYHIQVEKMNYSTPYEYVGKRVEVKLTKDTVTVYYKKNQICQHKRLYGHRNQYSTNEAHMPKNHQLFQWNKERFMNWAATIGPSTVELINLMFSRYKVEEQAYKGCLSILKLSDKYSQARLENACKLALSRLSNPTYKNIKLILESGQDEAKQEPENTINKEDTTYAFTRGTEYYGGKK